jgi:hypothetical protein
MTEITAACVTINKSLKLPRRQYVIAVSARFIPGRGVWFLKFRDPASVLPHAWAPTVVNPPAPLVPASPGGRFRLDGPYPFWPWGSVSGVPVELAHRLCSISPPSPGAPLPGVHTGEHEFLIRGAPPIIRIERVDDRPAARFTTIRLLFEDFAALAAATTSAAVVERSARDVRIYLDGAELGPLPRCCHTCGGPHDASQCSKTAPGPPHCYLCGSISHGGRKVTSCPLWKEAALLRRREVHQHHFELVHQHTHPDTKDYARVRMEIDLGIFEDDPVQEQDDMDWEPSQVLDQGLMAALGASSPSFPPPSSPPDPAADAVKRARLGASPDPPPPEDEKEPELSTPAEPSTAPFPRGKAGPL